jgi:hypothetical protein
MTRVLTLRVRPELLAKTEARATQLGLDCGKYVRDLMERDLKEMKPGARAFASEDFIGSVPLGEGPYDNRRVRETVRTRGRIC